MKRMQCCVLAHLNGNKRAGHGQIQYDAISSYDIRVDLQAARPHEHEQELMTASEKTVSLLTCSMAADLDIFALLAASVDRHLDSRIRHDVVVPSADIAAFRIFETPNRQIIAQEDVLPVKLLRLPQFLELLAPLKSLFRRPLYLTPKGQLVRGWMVQQCLKIGMARQSTETAIMHVDSDVCFFRHLSPEDAFDGEHTRFFRAEGEIDYPMHNPWLNSAADFLGVSVPTKHQAHYVENCILWDTGVAKAMAAQIEDTHSRPLHEVIFAAKSMSEYYVYGLFAELFPAGEALLSQEFSFCNSYWPSDESAPVNFDELRRKKHPKHFAMAIQSTHRLDLDARQALYERAEQELV